MAFMGIFLTFLVVFLLVIGASCIVAFICFLVSGLAMVRLKKKADGKVKAPWYVVLLRIIGSVALVPLVLTVCLLIYAMFANAIDKKTNLARAVMSYDYEQAEKILKNGADPDIRDKNGETLIMCLVNAETYISADDGNYYYYAGNYDGEDMTEMDMEMIELLLDYGADIDAAYPDCGERSEHTYSEGGWTDIYANSEHPCGKTALFFAVEHRSPEMVEFLIENGADVNATNACGFTPILICADVRSDYDGGLEIANMLLDSGADTGAISNFRQDIGWLISRRNSSDNIEMAALFEGGS